MVEKRKNGFRAQEFVEVDGSIARKMTFILASDTQEARRRAKNRRMIEEQQGSDMVARLGAKETLETISNNGTGIISKRRSSGGRH